MNKLSVLICAPLPPPKGGIATWVEEVIQANELAPVVNINIFNTAGNRGAGVYSNSVRIKDGLRLLWSQILSFKKCLITEKSISIVHISSSGGFAHFRDFLFCLISKYYKKKIIIQLHYGVNDTHYIWAPFSKLLLKLNTLLADKILTLDPTYYEKSNSKVSLSFNGMTERVNNFKEKEKSILYVGWIIEQKGIFELIEAWNSLNDKKGWKLKVVGPSQEYEKNKLLNNLNLNDTEYLGELTRDEVLEHTRKSSVFTLPSHTEGFPYAVLEAMQSNTAILVTKVGGMPQLFNFEESPGWILEPSDTASIKNILNNIINDSEQVEKFSSNAYKIFKDNYTNKHMLTDLIEHWMEIK